MPELLDILYGHLQSCSSSEHNLVPEGSSCLQIQGRSKYANFFHMRRYSHPLAKSWMDHGFISTAEEDMYLISA